MTPVRAPQPIAVMAGHFASQPLVFAHLLDAADRAGAAIDLDRVEVVQGAGRQARLAHYFAADVAARICEALGDRDTCVLLTDPTALPPADTEHLCWLGVFEGALIRARPEASC